MTSARSEDEGPAPSTYQRNERGSWVPSADPKSIAKEMTAHSLMNWYPIKAWIYSETSSWGRDTDAILPSQRGEASRKRLQLTLNTDRRRFHSICAEGAERIGGDLTVEVHMLVGGDDELGGYVRHWPKRDDGADGDDLLGTVQMRQPMVDQLLAGLRTGRQVAVGIQMPTYKETINHSFDEDWMLQDIYVPYGESIVIDAFQIQVVEEYGMPTGDTDTSPPLVHSNVVAAPSTVLHPELLKRINWSLAVLTLIAVLLAIR